MPESSFVLTTLGELRLEGTTGPVLPGRRKELVLLAILARRSPKPVSRDELAALLWGERDGEKARQSLRQALHQLRQALGPAIEVTSDKVRVMDGAVGLDATILEDDIAAGRHQEAVARWNGDFLLAMEDAGDDAYRSWLEAEREALRRSVAKAFSRLSNQARAEGRVDQEVEWTRQWTARFPLDEQAHVQLIDALRRQGDVDAARALYGTFVSRLKSEFDASPSVELIRLGELLTRASSQERQRKAGSGALHAPALTGRGATIAASLIELWARVRAQGSTVILEGERGTGKTRLAAELLRRARADKPPPFILQARGEEGDTASDWSTLRRLLTPLLNGPAIEDAPARTLAELTEALPALRERFPNLGQPGGTADRLESAFRDLFRSLASRTSVLLILDDAGKADAVSLHLLRALASSSAAGTMLVYTLRSDDAADAGLARDLGELPVVRRFKLAMLSREDVAQVIDSMIDVAPSDRSSLADTLHRETGGNPHALTARVSGMTDSGALTLNDGGVWRLSPGFLATEERANETSLSSASDRRHSAETRSGRPEGRWIWAGIAALVILAAIPLTRQALSGERVTTDASPRVAVLDFEVVTRDTLDAFLASGLAEEINASLARIEGLRLKSRGVVHSAQSNGLTDPLQLGKDLQVDYLVEGALRRVGSQLKVSIRLTQATDGFQVWSNDFDADASLPSLRDQIAREVVSRVGGRLAGEFATRRPLTSDAQAYEHYLRGNYYLARRTPTTVQQAIEQYRAAVARDTAFAASWARIAYSYALLLDWGWAHGARSVEEVFLEGLELAKRAIELDSLSDDAWMAKAYLLASADPVRMRGAAEAFEHAIVLNPRNAEALHQYAQVHEALGNWESAMVAFRRTLLLEPDRSLPYVAMASIAWKQGQPLVAQRLYDSALVVDPGAAYVLSARAVLRLVAFNDSTGGLEDAETAVRVNESYSIPPHSVLTMALARTGSKARAELEVQRALSELADPNSPSPTDARWLAGALLSVGRNEDALNLIARARPRGAWLWFYCLASDFDAIRRDPRFVRIMAEAHPSDLPNPLPR